jgi:fructose-1,6-bisphosphatase/inositol monophosphatase family enzyme
MAQADLTLAGELVRAAGDLAANMLREGLTVDHQTSVSDVVSTADRAAERLIVDRLRAERPDDAIVGEEGTADPGSDGRASGRTWYVDPVDGTYNFLSGLPTWCAAVALTESGAPPLGAVYQPTTAELWLGGNGNPTARNDVRLPSLEARPLAEVSVTTYLHPTTLPDDSMRVPLLRVIGAAATVRMLGSGSVEMAAVAAGRIGLSFQADSLPWDWLPGAALVLAAGGAAEVIEVSGHRWHLAGNRRAVDEAAALLQRTG